MTMFPASSEIITGNLRTETLVIMAPEMEINAVQKWSSWIRWGNKWSDCLIWVFFFRAGLIAHARRPDDKWQHSEKHTNIIGIINAGLGTRR